MHATMKDVSVNRTREEEAPACLAVLPEVVGSSAELLIARKDGKFAGAAAVLWASWAEPAGFSVLVRVLKSVHGQGVGRRLIEAAADLADGETDGLWSFRAMPLESPAAKFLEACGFVPRKREHYFQVGLASMLDHIQPVAQRYRERAQIPEGAEVVFLSDVEGPLDEIAWLLAREFNSSPRANVQNLDRRRRDPDDGSIIARANGEVVGVLLSHGHGDTAFVDVRVVAKRWRLGWPNLMMMEKGLFRARDIGRQHIKFYCDETLNDTRNLAKRGKGEETDIKTRHYLAFD
jgi:GNAT superfamily N-acetyltransferase